MATQITLTVLQDLIERGAAIPLYNVTISGQQRLYAKKLAGPIVYAVVS